jgi:hypothetical protein
MAVYALHEGGSEDGWAWDTGISLSELVPFLSTNGGFGDDGLLELENNPFMAPIRRSLLRGGCDIMSVYLESKAPIRQNKLLPGSIRNYASLSMYTSVYVVLVVTEFASCTMPKNKTQVPSTHRFLNITSNHPSALQLPHKAMMLPVKIIFYLSVLRTQPHENGLATRDNDRDADGPTRPGNLNN